MPRSKGRRILAASRTGNATILEELEGWIVNEGHTAWDSMRAASEYGHINILNWWLEVDRKLKGTMLKVGTFGWLHGAFMNVASEKGHVNVLQWWKDSGLSLQYVYTEEAMRAASCNGHVNVLQWWKDSGLELKYDESAVDHTVRPKSLKWWKESRLPLKYSNWALIWCTWGGNGPALKWWKASGLELKYDEKTVAYAKDSSTLNWWRNSGLLRYDESAMDTAGALGKFEVLDWWKGSGLALCYSEKAIEDIDHRIRKDTVEWFRKNDLKLRVPPPRPSSYNWN